MVKSAMIITCITSTLVQQRVYTHTLFADGEECYDHHVQAGQVEQEHPTQWVHGKERV